MQLDRTSDGSHFASNIGMRQQGCRGALAALRFLLGEDVWWVRDDGLRCVILSLALILVVKFLGGGGTSSRLW